MDAEYAGAFDLRDLSTMQSGSEISIDEALTNPLRPRGLIRSSRLASAYLLARLIESRKGHDAIKSYSTARRGRLGAECYAELRGLGSLLPQSDELPASSQALRRGAAQLSRPPVAPRRIRHATTATNRAGELFGLMRVRSLQMNDAHIYCTEEQFEDEFNAVNEMYLKYFKIFGIEKYVMRFSHPRPVQARAKSSSMNPSSGSRPRTWCATSCNAAGSTTSKCLTKPRSTGRRSTCRSGAPSGANSRIATNQVDFAVPARFGLIYKTRDNTEARRSASTARRSARTSVSSASSSNITPATSRSGSRRNKSASCRSATTQPLLEYAKRHSSRTARPRSPRRARLRATITIKAKIASAEQMKVHTMLVIGNRDMEAGDVSVRVHGKGNLGAKPRAEVVADLLQSIKERRA